MMIFKTWSPHRARAPYLLYMVIVLPMPTYMHLHVVPFLILHESPSHACVFSRFVRMRAAYRTIASRAFGRC